MALFFYSGDYAATDAGHSGDLSFARSVFHEELKHLIPTFFGELLNLGNRLNPASIMQKLPYHVIIHPNTRITIKIQYPLRLRHIGTSQTISGSYSRQLLHR